MTTPATTTFYTYVSDGTTLTYNVPMLINASTDLKIYIQNVLQTTSYSITGITPTQFTLTFSGIAIAVNEIILIFRSTIPILSSLSAGTPIMASGLNPIFLDDYLTQFDNQFFISNLCTRFPITTLLNEVLPTSAQLEFPLPTTPITTGTYNFYAWNGTEWTEIVFDPNTTVDTLRTQLASQTPPTGASLIGCNMDNPSGATVQDTLYEIFTQQITMGEQLDGLLMDATAPNTGGSELTKYWNGTTSISVSSALDILNSGGSVESLKAELASEVDPVGASLIGYATGTTVKSELDLLISPATSTVFYGSGYIYHWNGSISVTIKTQLDALQVLINTNTTDISTNTTAIATNTTNISSNTTSINSILLAATSSSISGAANLPIWNNYTNGPSNIQNIINLLSFSPNGTTTYGSGYIYHWDGTAAVTVMSVLNTNTSAIATNTVGIANHQTDIVALTIQANTNTSELTALQAVATSTTSGTRLINHYDTNTLASMPLNDVINGLEISGSAAALSAELALQTAPTGASLIGCLNGSTGSTVQATLDIITDNIESIFSTSTSFGTGGSSYIYCWYDSTSTTINTAINNLRTDLSDLSLYFNNLIFVGRCLPGIVPSSSSYSILTVKNNQSIGSASSGATFASPNYQALYLYIKQYYTLVSPTQAATDWAANLPLTISTMPNNFMLGIWSWIWAIT